MENVKNWLMDGSGFDDGSGDGSGFGFGFGYGDGSGFGFGFGYGNGNGNGDGNGDGNGNGNGNGDGFGFGEGSGDGFGGGFGKGFGYGISNFEGMEVHLIDSVSTIIKHIKGPFAKGYIFNKDFTLTPCYVAKGNGYFAHGKTLKEAQSALRDKIFENMKPDETIKAFLNTFKHGKKYAGTDFFEWHHLLTGSCLMGREAFVANKGLDVNANYSVDEFISLCENDYGSKIIKQLKIEYEELKKTLAT